MSLTSSFDDWLKRPAAGVGDDDDDDEDPAMSIAASMPDIPDLGLGTLSAEDIKWVDLEFLDLASGPPALNQFERNRTNRNPTLGCNFPDIFFDMTMSSSVGGNAAGACSSSVSSSFFNVDEPPSSMPFLRDQQLDLEDSVEKHFLADLFPPSAHIEQARMGVLECSLDM
jgi:hypothetical protein